VAPGSTFAATDEVPASFRLTFADGTVTEEPFTLIGPADR
jgi:hypothetical protein